jgi:hypothetical protein
VSIVFHNFEESIEQALLGLDIGENALGDSIKKWKVTGRVLFCRCFSDFN